MACERVAAGGPEWWAKQIGHDGVAVTPRNYRSGNYPAACWLVAALLMAMTVLASAQSGQGSAAGAPAAEPAVVPSGPAVQPPTQQTVPTPASPAAQASGLALPQPPPAEKRGFLNDFGRWWNDSIADFNAKMKEGFKEQQSKIDDFNKKSADAAKDAATATQEAMKNAADAMVHLSTPSKVIEVQQTCPIAGNGAADCATAATNACKGKGFSSGQPLDVRTAEKCNASLWVSGQNPSAADCPVETVVLRVACQ
jgi:hypothetical protein